MSTTIPADASSIGLMPLTFCEDGNGVLSVSLLLSSGVAVDEVVLSEADRALLKATLTGDVTYEWPELPALPVWLCTLSPTTHTFPSASSIIVARPAALILTAFVTGTVIGLLRSFVVPSPICPIPLPPQATTVPFASKATECSMPASIIITLSSPGTLDRIVSDFNGRWRVIIF